MTEASEAEPRINLHIGRLVIEQEPRQVEQKRQPTRPRMPMSLSDYLRERGGGETR